MGTYDFICPVCNSGRNKSVCPDVNYIHRCGECGVVFNSGFRSLEYDENYFLDQYKKQYGRTYLEDFDNIYGISLRRIENIVGLLGEKADISNCNLFDIGSAMGFFLKAAKDSGFGRVLGLEISSYAADFCFNEYNLKTINSSFEDFNIDRTFNVITAWYFIEHCPDPVETVKRIHDALSLNGIFAFSVPSIFGPLYLFHRYEWIKTHPVDHRIDFSPFSVKNFLRRIGFDEIIIKSGGIHPERILSGDGFCYKAFSSLYSKAAGLLSFSDTLEVYAIKR